MPFFETTTAKRDSFSDRCTNKLYSALLTKKKILPMTKKSVWAREFLAMKEDFSEEEIEKILDWYCEHVGKRYVPVARSAAAFRKKFLAICDAKINNSYEEQEIKISDRARKIQRQSGFRLWSDKDNGVDWGAEELRFIQACLENYQDFLDRLTDLRLQEERALLEVSPSSKAEAAVWRAYHRLVYLQSVVMNDAEEFVGHWIEKTNLIFHRKKATNLQEFVWKPVHLHRLKPDLDAYEVGGFDLDGVLRELYG